MEFLSLAAQDIIPFLGVLTVLVFVHELGHFLVARRNGVRIEVFSIGFGKELWGFNDRHGTRWRLSLVPLGGYVKMFGEGDMVTGVDDTEERPMTEAEKEVSFHHKRLGQRAAIVAAGPVANFVFAILVLWAVNSIYGMPRALSVVGAVMSGTAAEDAGFQAGDEIVTINGQKVQLFSQLSAIVSANAGSALFFGIERGGKRLNITATPRPWTAPGAGADVRPKGLLGVRPDPKRSVSQRAGVATGLLMGVEQTYALSARILSGIGEMFTGRRSTKELGGVIMIAEVSGDAARGGMLPILRFLAILSINLGLINLFPVPVLDGGHLVFYAAEAVRGRPLSPKIQEYGFRLGLVLVLILMVFATWNDFERILGRFGLI